MATVLGLGLVRVAGLSVELVLLLVLPVLGTDGSAEKKEDDFVFFLVAHIIVSDLQENSMWTLSLWSQLWLVRIPAGVWTRSRGCH